jgi:hypothetical protein
MQPDAGLIFATCEMILTFGTERTYIWKYEHSSLINHHYSLLSQIAACRNPQGSILIKFLYLFSRYFALAVHMQVLFAAHGNCCGNGDLNRTNTVLVSLVNKYTIIPKHLCQIAVIYQGATLFIMVGILDLILILRGAAYRCFFLQA